MTPRALPVFYDPRFLAAARCAAKGTPVAVSPTSGFHHAGWSHGGGYCTFNGLMLAAKALLDEGLADKVGILDLDTHYGGHRRL